MSPRDSTRRREWIAISALTTVGAILRFWHFGALGLEHFDEGVYALSGLWSLDPSGLWSLDPMVIPYGPAGFPILIGVAYALLGVSDHAAIVAATVCGVASIPVMGWLGRRTFGPGAGAGSSALAALALAHIGFSRHALTDAPFLLAWLVALGAGQRFLEAPGFMRAVMLGIAVGAAQHVKYNGWVAGAIVIVTALLGPLASLADRPRPALARTWGWGLVAALTAGLVVLPWVGFVERHGGYDDLIRHQRGYAGGVWTWLPHWSQQMAQSVALGGGFAWSAGSWCLAWVVTGLAVHGLRRDVQSSRLSRPRFLLGLLAGAAAWGAIPTLPWWLGLAALPSLLRDARPAVRLVGAWWLVLTILTPFYHPYARLWLPLHGVGWLVVADAICLLGPFATPDVALQAGPWRFPRPGRRIAVVASILGVGWIVHARSGAEPFPIARHFASTTTFRDLADDLAAHAPRPGESGHRFVLLARRPLSFYLLLKSRTPVRLLSGLEQLRTPGILGDFAFIDEAVVLSEGELVEAGMLSGRGRSPGINWVQVGRVPIRLDPITRLDVDPMVAFGTPKHDDLEISILAPKSSPWPVPITPTLITPIK